MSQVPSSGPEDDEISLAVSFQGLRISVVGPATKALDFVHKLSPEHQRQEVSSTASSSELPAAPVVVPDPIPCPASVLALASRLSAASILTPEERVKRAWLCGLHARALLDSRPAPSEPVIAIDLPAKYWVVLRGRGYSSPRTLRNPAQYQRAFSGIGAPAEVGHEFPSETEARAYLTAAGYGYLAGV